MAGQVTAVKVLLKFDPNSMASKHFMEELKREKKTMLQEKPVKWDIERQAEMNQTKSSKSKEIVAGNSMKGKTFSVMYFEIDFELHPFF